MKKSVITIAMFFVGVTTSMAQCAMCRATLENNLSNGNPGIAAGINFGILYLFFAPYIAVGTIAYFWFRTSRNNAVKKSLHSSAAG